MSRSDVTRPAKRIASRSENLWDRPGFLVRRLHQIGVAIFMEGMADLGLTPLQFGALTIIASTPGIEQSTIGETLGIDRVNAGDIVKRLMNQGLLTRRVAAHDRRFKNVFLTSAGEMAVASGLKKIQGISDKLLTPLGKTEKEQFIRLAQKLVVGNNDYGPALLIPVDDKGSYRQPQRPAVTRRNLTPAAGS